MTVRETRSFNFDQFNKRDGTDATPGNIKGYASVFNSPTIIGGYFQETIAPGAFSRTLNENDDIRALFSHDWANVIGRTKAKTLTLDEDKTGLAFDLELPNTTVGRDLAVSMERGDINQMSFGFVVVSDEWDYSDESLPKRTVTDVDLYEISVVALPAYDDTTASLSRDKENDSSDLITSIKQRQKLIQNIERQKLIQKIQNTKEVI